MHRMNLLKTLQNIRSSITGQGKTCAAPGAGRKNVAALRCLNSLEYPPSNIRKALFALNGLRITDFSTDEVSRDNFYKILERGRGSLRGMAIVSETLNVKKEEFFPESNGDSP